MAEGVRATIHYSTPRPMPGQPYMSVEQLREYVCNDAICCPLAERCAAQVVGPDAVCLFRTEKEVQA